MQTAHMQRRQCVRGGERLLQPLQGQRGAGKCGVCSTVTCVGRLLATGRPQGTLQQPWRRY